jgi:hypothetical protein
VIIENYFGRLNQKFRIMSQTFRSERINFALYFETCCALVNFDIVYCKAALRLEDQEVYIGIINKMIREGEATIQKGKGKAIAQYQRRMRQVQQTEIPYPERRAVKKIRIIRLPTSRIFSQYSDFSD